MKCAIVCYYADLGRPYAPLIERMTATARAVMPEASLVLLTPTPETPVASCFDETYDIDRPTDFRNICLERARAISSWAIQRPEPTIFVDPDIEFLRPVEIDGSYDIGLLWRDRPDQPINTGLIVARNQRVEFWKHYGNVAVNLPLQIHSWFCDQLAFNLLTGICHKAGDGLMVDDARVRLLDMGSHCPPNDEMPEQGRPGYPWAVHLKGRRKGPGWEKIYRDEREERAA